MQIEPELAEVLKEAAKCFKGVLSHLLKNIGFYRICKKL